MSLCCFVTKNMSFFYLNYDAQFRALPEWIGQRKSKLSTTDKLVFPKKASSPATWSSRKEARRSFGSHPSQAKHVVQDPSHSIGFYV